MTSFRPVVLALVALGVGILSMQPRTEAALIIANATLSGAQEVPPVATAAAGAAILTVDTVTSQYTFSLHVEGITPAQLAGAGPNSTPAHLHFAPPGANGPIVVDLGFHGTIAPLGTTGFQLNVPGATFGGMQGALSGPAPATNIANLLAGDLYVNVHTATFPGGEIRGQLDIVIPEPTGVAVAGACLVGLLRRQRC